MENINNWLTKPVEKDDVELWFNMNNMIPEKMELYYDFVMSLIDLMNQTYFGLSNDYLETKINLTTEDDYKHFEWCWEKTVSQFEKENVIFQKKGEHFEYFQTFFSDIFYEQQNEDVRKSIPTFFSELFDLDKTFTKADLDLFTDLYKTMDKNLVL